MKTILLTLLLAGTITLGFGQKQPPVIDTIITSAICGDCKARIEEKLNFTKGIIYAEQNLQTKELVVKYKPNKISKEEILKLISLVGYAADDVPADKKAYEELPKCCQNRIVLS